MSFQFGNRIKVTIFGQSHAEAMGVVIDGLPAGAEIDIEEIKTFMARRRPGSGRAEASVRHEADEPLILAGLYEGKTCGTPLAAVIMNEDHKSSDYDMLKTFYRPGHADYPAEIKYDGNNDIRGGGAFSGRMTALLCFAGGVCKQLLKQCGVTVGGHVASIGSELDDLFDYNNVIEEELEQLAGMELPLLNETAAENIEALLAQVREQGDSVGGVGEIAVIGMPVGIGEPMFESVESVLSQLLFSVPGVKGVEFGSGFAGAEMLGSENNDPFRIDEKGKVYQTKNDCGGILGGLTTGAPIIVRAVFKPVPTINKPQDTVNKLTGEDATVTFDGRHDACILPRGLVVLEAAVAIGCMDLLMMS